LIKSCENKPFIKDKRKYYFWEYKLHLFYEKYKISEKYFAFKKRGNIFNIWLKLENKLKNIFRCLVRETCFYVLKEICTSQALVI